MVLREGGIKTTQNMLGYIKIKNVCASKDTINRVKIKWNGRKHCKSGKGLISRIIKNTYNWTAPLLSNLIKNGQWN